ncbi:MAG: amidohydrolase family protein [Acidobacteria bacterium]|nr:amidohydrolase family protein [Acidobacteriota bacterium]
MLYRFVSAVTCGVIAAVAAGWLSTSAAAQVPAPLVIDGGTLIDGNGGAPVPDAVVIIQGDRIAAVSRRGQAAIPANAQVIRADGKFILPGLWDSQVSYQWYYGEVMLNYGITSTIDVGIAGEIGAPHRDAVHKGLIRGPRPFTGISRFTDEPVGGTGLETPGTPGRTPKTAEEARAYVRTWAELGADMIQIAEGGLPMEINRAVADEAKRVGKPTFMRAYGPVLGPREAALLGTTNMPHSAGIGRTVARTPVTSEDDPRNEADLYSEMDEAKARDLIQLLVKHNVALTPTFRATYPGFQRDWDTFAQEDRRFFDTADPALVAYYPPERIETALAIYRGRPGGTGAVRERRLRGYLNALRFHKMFADAGGRVVPGANTNPTRVPGNSLIHEMRIFVEAGIPPMQIIQGATKWSAEMIARGKDLGTIEPGKLADILIVNADPLQNIDNLRQVDTVIFNGTRVERGYSAGYNPVFKRDSEMNPPVEALLWVNAFQTVAFTGSGGRFNGQRPVGPGQPLPNPSESPQPAIESITPIMVTEGSPTTTITLRGFNFVRRSQVLFRGVPVPFTAVSGSELQVTLDTSLLREPGWHELVVRNPWPLHPEIGQQWGNGTSNKAHLIVRFRDSASAPIAAADK